MKPIFFDKHQSYSDYLYAILLSSTDNQLISYLVKKHGIKTILFNEDELRADWIEKEWQKFVVANSNYLSPSLIAAIGWYSAINAPNHEFFSIETVAGLFANKQYRLALYLLLDKFKFNNDFDKISEKLSYCLDNYGCNKDLMPLIHALYLHNYSPEFIKAYFKTIARAQTLIKLDTASIPKEKNKIEKYFDKLYESITKNLTQSEDTAKFLTEDHTEYYSSILSASEDLTKEQIQKFFLPLYARLSIEEQIIFKDMESDIITKNLDENDSISQKIKMVIIEMEKYPQEKSQSSKLWSLWDMAYCLFSHLYNSLIFLNLKELPERIYADIIQAKNCIMHSPVLAFSLAAPLIFFNPFLGTVIASESLLFAVDAYRGNPRFHFGVNQAIEDAGHAYDYIKDKLRSGALLSRT